MFAHPPPDAQTHFHTPDCQSRLVNCRSSSPRAESVSSPLAPAHKHLPRTRQHAPGADLWRHGRTRRRAGGSTVQTRRRCHCRHRHSFGASAGASGECPRGRRLGSVSEEARRCVTEVCVGGVSGRPPLGSVSEEAPAPSRRPSFAGPSCACAPAGSGGGRCGGSE